MTEVAQDNKLTKKELRKLFWRSAWTIQFSHNYERMQSLGTLYALQPVLSKLYKGKPKEQRVAAQKRHLEFFNSHPALDPFILGITAAMEENTAEDEKDSVIAVKTSLMGPLAGLGDSMLNFTWTPIAGSIGASFAIQGNFLGAILMFLMINCLYWPLKYYGVMWGYNQGRSLLTSANGKKILDRISTGANVLGVMVTGALITSTVTLKTGLTYGSGKTAIDVQSMLDKVVPFALPLLITLLCLYLIKKWNGKHVVALIFGIIIVAIALSALGIIA